MRRRRVKRDKNRLGLTGVKKFFRNVSSCIFNCNIFTPPLDHDFHTLLNYGDQRGEGSVPSVMFFHEDLTESLSLILFSQPLVMFSWLPAVSWGVKK